MPEESQGEIEDDGPDEVEEPDIVDMGGPVEEKHPDRVDLSADIDCRLEDDEMKCDIDGTIEEYSDGEVEQAVNFDFDTNVPVEALNGGGQSKRPVPDVTHQPPMDEVEVTNTDVDVKESKGIRGKIKEFLT